MLRHSVLCRDSGARHCIATRLCSQDKDALSRQCGAALHRDNMALRCVVTKKVMRMQQTNPGAHDKAGHTRQRYSVATDFLQW